MRDIIHLMETIGQYLRAINEFLFFYVDIETNLSLAILVAMWVLYAILKKYLSDKKLTSIELIQLLLWYGVILTLIVGSYTDLQEIVWHPSPRSSFTIITLISVVLIVLVAWLGASEDDSRKMKWILLLLYTPIILLIISNGRILEDQLAAVQSLIPRSNAGFIRLPGEIRSLNVGGSLSSEQISRLEAILQAHQAVDEGALVTRKDEDGLVKTYAFVVLSDRYSPSDRLKSDILDHVYEQIADQKRLRYPHWVDFVDHDSLPAGDPHYDYLIELLRSHSAVADCAVVSQRKENGDMAPYAYLSLNAGYTESEGLKTDIKDYARRQVNRRRISMFMAPQWVEFIEKQAFPKSSDGQVKRYLLQKRVMNYTRVFPGYGRSF